MYKKFELSQTKIKRGCQSGRKVVTHNSKSDLPLAYRESLSLPSNFQVHALLYRKYVYRGGMYSVCIALCTHCTALLIEWAVSRNKQNFRDANLMRNFSKFETWPIAASYREGKIVAATTSWL